MRAAPAGVTRCERRVLLRPHPKGGMLSGATPMKSMVTRHLSNRRRAYVYTAIGVLTRASELLKYISFRMNAKKDTELSFPRQSKPSQARAAPHAPPVLVRRIMRSWPSCRTTLVLAASKFWPSPAINSTSRSRVGTTTDIILLPCHHLTFSCHCRD